MLLASLFWTENSTIRVSCQTRSRATTTVLIVDDDPEIQALVADVLEMGGFKPHCVEEPASAVETACRLQPDVILLDLMMPEVDGWEVARRLRAEARTRTIPIVVMTGMDRPEEQA